MTVSTTGVVIAATETPQEFANASSITGGFADSSGLGPVIVFLVYIVAVLFAAQFVAPWLANSSLLNRLGSGFLDTVVYAIKGLATTAVLAVAALPVWVVAQADAGTRAVAFRYVGFAIAAFVGLAVIGWLADRAVAKFIEAHPDYESWGDIWSGEEDDVAEPEAAD